MVHISSRDQTDRRKFFYISTYIPHRLDRQEENYSTQVNTSPIDQKDRRRTIVHKYILPIHQIDRRNTIVHKYIQSPIDQIDRRRTIVHKYVHPPQIRCTPQYVNKYILLHQIRKIEGELQYTSTYSYHRLERQEENSTL